MLRLKLCGFYAYMAVLTLLKPREGIDMLACAKRGAKARHREWVFAHYAQLVQREAARHEA